MISKIDRITGAGLAGAVFELLNCRGFVSTGTTDSAGQLVFCVLPCNTYLLRETDPPPGYEPLNNLYRINVNASGCIFVNGTLTSCIVIANNAVTASFTAVKVNIETGTPLAGAVYTLFSGTVEIASTVSTNTGAVTFTRLSPGIYELVETTPPAGFQTNTDRLAVVVAADGSVTILGQPADGFLLSDVPLRMFAFRKLDALTEIPLAGAEFQLSQNGTVVAAATSDTEGLVDFGVLEPDSYQLTESVTPSGYLPNGTIYQVVAGADGSITVEGTALDGFRLENVRLPGFSFIKTSGVTGMVLADAVFELRQNGTLIQTSTSDISGSVSFSSLLPGSYQLTEIVSPPGYLPNSSIYQVAVSSSGSVIIDGVPYQEFGVVNMAQSAPPFLFWVFEYDREIYGEGIPGSLITVTLPDGSELTTTVGLFEGDVLFWVIELPPSAPPLLTGQVITVVQTEPGKLPSEPATTVVIHPV